MREIKFRCWCPETRRMFLVENLTWENGKIVTIEGTSLKTGEACSIWNNEPYELMQWTGLYDINKKEIWEGDIVLHEVTMFGIKEKIPLVVKFDKGAFEAFMPEEKNLPSIPTYFCSALFNCEVIGNICEDEICAT